MRTINAGSMCGLTWALCLSLVGCGGNVETDPDSSWSDRNGVAGSEQVAPSEPAPNSEGSGGQTGEDKPPTMTTGTGGTTDTPPEPIAPLATSKDVLVFPGGNGGGRLQLEPMGENMAVTGKGIIPEQLGRPSNALDPSPFVLTLNSSKELVDYKAFPGVGDILELAVRGDKIAIAGYIGPDTQIGEFTFQPEDGRFYLAVLDDQLNVLQAIAIPAPDPDGSMWLGPLHMTAEGSLLVAFDLSNPEPSRLLVKSYGSTLVQQWSQLFVGTDYNFAPYALSELPSGRLALAGSFSGSVTLGETVLTSTATNDQFSSYNGFYTVLDETNGAPLLATRIGGQSFDYINSMSLSETGSVHVAGSIEGTSHVAGLEVVAHELGSGFVAELDDQGEALWVSHNPAESFAVDVASPAGGGALLYGFTQPDKHLFIGRVQGDEASYEPLTLSPVYNLGHMALDSSEGIWISAEFEGELELVSETVKYTEPYGQVLFRIE